jgi:serine/threonine protein kinase
MVIARGGEVSGPFYVMRRFDSSLRHMIKARISTDRVLPLFSQILDGVEAAHLQGVVHRDLKPENILYKQDADVLAVADFGTARFTEDQVVTTVETGPADRLANFLYAAPEQRIPGKQVLAAADIWALGLMMHEMFTGEVPHGTAHRRIAQVANDFGFLDEIVGQTRRQAPEDRPKTVADLKGLIVRHQSQAVSLQRLSQINNTIIKMDEIDEPLALTPPRLVDAYWDRGELKLMLDRVVTPMWINALQWMRGYRSVLGKEPSRFSFVDKRATINAAEHQVQAVIGQLQAVASQYH